MKKIFLLLALFLLAMPVVFSQPQYSNWGFAGYSYGSFLNPRTLWGSQILDGTEPEDAINITLINYRMPLITNLNYASQLSPVNEIYLFSQTQLNIFDETFSQISSYNMLNWNGTASIVYMTGSNKYFIAYLSDDGGDDTLKIINRTGSSFSLIKTINITNKAYTGDLKGGLKDYAYAYDSSYNITRINLIDGTETVYPTFHANITKCAVTQSPYFQNDVEVNDLDSDGFDDVLVIGKTAASTTAFIGILSTNSASWVMTKTITSVNAASGCSIASAQIGSSGTAKKLIMQTRSGSDAINKVYDQSGNLLFSQSAGYEYNFPAVADINIDSKNELLVPDSADSLLVYDDAFSLITTIKTARTRSSRTTSSIYTVGSFLTGSTWLDIVGPQGISQVNTTHTGASLTYPFGNEGTTGTFATLAVPVTSQSVKDIITLSDTIGVRNVLFRSAVAGAVCGDGSCSAGETALTCPEDCAPTIPESAVITSVEIDPCYTVQWKQNTTVGVTVIAQNINQDNVNLFIEFTGSALFGCGQAINITGVKSGSVNTVNFIANCTGTSFIRVAANTDLVPDKNYLTFPFTVGDTGAEYGDSSCGVNQPLSAVLPAANTTTDLEENFLTQGMRQFSDYTKLGLNVLTFFILIFVTGAIFFTGAKAGYSMNMVSGIILLVDAFIVLIAVNLGWLNVGIVITLAIVGLIVIGLWIAKAFNSNNN